MKLLFDILIAIPIGIMYNLIILKFGDVFNSQLSYKIKTQRNLLLAFSGAIFAFLINQYMFCDECEYKNKSIKYGLYLGSIILLIYVVLYNWNILENDSKLIIMFVTFISLMMYSYNSNLLTYDEDFE